jgi:hypothetical protein
MAKIRRGERVRGDVYDRIGTLLGWEPGDAKRCADTGEPPRPIGEDMDVNAARVEVMRTLSEATAAAPGATESALAQARRQAEEILRTLRSDNS